MCPGRPRVQQDCAQEQRTGGFEDCMCRVNVAKCSYHFTEQGMRTRVPVYLLKIFCLVWVFFSSANWVMTESISYCLEPEDQSMQVEKGLAKSYV